MVGLNEKCESKRYGEFRGRIKQRWNRSPGVRWTCLATWSVLLISKIEFLLVENFNEGHCVASSAFNILCFRDDSLNFWMCAFESNQIRCRLLNSHETRMVLLCRITYLHTEERELNTYLHILLSSLLSFGFWIQFFYLCHLCSLLLLPVLLLCCRQFWKKM